MENRQSTGLTQLFSALGDSTRFKMVQLVVQHPKLCVSELAESVGITPAGASQHLDILERAGLLKPYRDGKKICYQLVRNQNNKALLKLMEEKA